MFLTFLIRFLPLLTNLGLAGLVCFLLKLRNVPTAEASAGLNLWVSENFAPCFIPTCLDGKTEP